MGCESACLGRSWWCHAPPAAAARHHTAHARTGAPPLSPAVHTTVSVAVVASKIRTVGGEGTTGEAMKESALNGILSMNVEANRQVWLAVLDG